MGKGWEVIDEKETVELEENEINLSGKGDVIKKILKKGVSDELPSTGCSCIVHYTGTLRNGTKFDSSLDRNEPFEFELNKGVVVKGFDISVASMKKGEKAVFKIIAEKATGPSKNPPKIPPNSTIIFEIELLDWHSENLSPRADGGIVRHVIKKPESHETPNDGSSVTIHLSGSYEGRVFDDRNLTFVIGETDDVVIPGIQRALKYFGKGESSRLVIKPEYAFGEKGDQTFEIPPNATVEYTVTLDEFERAPESWTLDTKENLAQAKLVKDRATGYLKQEKYDLAIKVYERANSYLQNITIPKPVGLELIDEPHRVKAAIFLNIAFCHLKLQNHYEAKKACDTVLDIDQKNVKAYYRRGTSYLESGDASAALEDFTKALKYQPENKATINQITICKQEIKKQDVKDKELYKNMLKFARENREKRAKV